MRPIQKKYNQTKITFELPAKIFPYPQIRTLTHEIVDKFMTLPLKWVKRIGMIVDELCNNAAEHGSSKNDQIKLMFQININKDITICVEDSGNGRKVKNITKVKKELIHNENLGSNENKSIRGRGLTEIVGKWADDFKIRKSDFGGLCFQVKINKK